MTFLEYFYVMLLHSSEGNIMFFLHLSDSIFTIYSKDHTITYKAFGESKEIEQVNQTANIFAQIQPPLNTLVCQ